MTHYLYLDIETLPTSDAAVMAEIAASVTPPGSYKKPETIAEWERETKPGLVKEAIAKTSFSGATGSLCCVGWAWNDAEPQSLTVGDDRTEAGVLRSLSMVLSDTRPSGYERPVIVGHYVAGFDIRFLWQRAFVLGVQLPAWFPRDPKPWADGIHDTMAMWGGKESISLDDLCRALLIPGKGNMTGADVADMWQRGEREAVAAYCRDDVSRVRAVHQRMMIAFGDVAA